MAYFVKEGGEINFGELQSTDDLDSFATVKFLEPGTFYFKVPNAKAGEQFGFLSDVSLIDAGTTGLIQNVTVIGSAQVFQLYFDDKTFKSSLVYNSGSSPKLDEILGKQYPSYINGSNFESGIIQPGNSTKGFSPQFFIAVSGDPDILRESFEAGKINPPEIGRALVVRGQISGQRDAAWGSWLEILKPGEGSKPVDPTQPVDPGDGAGVSGDLFNLPSTFDFSPVPGAPGSFMSPLYQLDPDGSWSIRSAAVPASAKGAAGELRDELFDQLGATAIDKLVDNVADKLGKYGDSFKKAVDQVKDSLDIKKILAGFWGGLLDTAEQGMDSVSGKNTLTLKEYDEKVNNSVSIFNSETRDYLEDKHGPEGGLIHDIFSGRIFSIQEVNSFSAIVFEEGAVASGGDKRDSFIGTSFQDVFKISKGGDLIWAGGGNDKFILGDSYDGTRISGGLGIDTVSAAENASRFQYSFGPSSAMLTGASGKVELLGVERIAFADKVLAIDTAAGENAGSAYRVYQAAFARTPDTDGLKFWIDSLDKGSSLKDVASAFLGSKEFLNTYGASPSNEALVGKMYQNILGRAPEAEGYNHWVGVLQRGAIDRGDLLAAFSESVENIKLVAPVVSSGIWLEI